MTLPRAHLVDPDNRVCYHVFSRCVRRAWLCGADALTGRSFEHRRQWIEDRVLFLAHRFAVAIHGYAVMSNHYHLVIEVDPQASSSWTADEVARRWLDLFPPQADASDAHNLLQRRRDLLVTDAARLALCRQRLGSLSWFMRLLNEPIARRANQEDICKGRFWEGRFASKILLDDAAWLAAAAYVDLNPVRAGLTDRPEAAAHTSIHRRVNTRVASEVTNDIAPVASGFAQPGHLPISLPAYCALLNATAHATQKSKQSTKQLRAFETPLGMSESEWLAHVTAMKRHDRRAFGQLASLLRYAQKVGQRWLRGVGSVSGPTPGRAIN